MGTVFSLEVEPGAKVIVVVVASQNKNGPHLILPIYVLVLGMNV